jgi:uncharacterized protein (TIGR03790 family)
MEFKMRLGYVVLLAFVATASAAALEPKDVFVVANKNVPVSRDVAEHYLAKRGVPRGNLILLDLPADEDISRADYDTKLAGPLRAALKDRKDAAKVLLSVYGVPLRVGGQESTAAEKVELITVKPALDMARKRVDELQKGKADVKDLADARRTVAELDRRWYALAHGEPGLRR